MPKVSIIVPVYNAEKVIKRCVDSILNQEYTDFELLLMDDGSKDGTKNILDSITDQRVHVIHKENSGVSTTRNMALDLAKGEYIQFLDADDWMTLNSTKELVRCMEENNVDLVIADFYRVVGDNLSKKGSIVSNEVLSLKEFANYMKDAPADYYYGVLWNKLFKKSIIDQFHLRMDPSLSYCEDFIFNMEYLLHCTTIAPLNIPIYYYVKTEGSLVAQNLNLHNIMKMKSYVFNYYDSFFRQVLNEEEYRNQRASISTFLISYAHDEFASPILPTTKKVGEEISPLTYNDSKSSNVMDMVYYLNKVYERLLNPIADKYQLELRDMKVLDALYQSNHIDDVKAIVDYTHLSEASVLFSIQILHNKEYINFNHKGSLIQLTSKADSICMDIDQAQSDLMEICGKHIEDFEMVCMGLFKMEENLLDYLK